MICGHIKKQELRRKAEIAVFLTETYYNRMIRFTTDNNFKIYRDAWESPSLPKTLMCSYWEMAGDMQTSNFGAQER